MMYLNGAEWSKIICTPWFIPLVLSPVGKGSFDCILVGREQVRGWSIAAFVSLDVKQQKQQQVAPSSVAVLRI